MNKKNVIITIKKELRSVFRDKKTIFMIFGFPFIIAFFVFFFGFFQEKMEGSGKTVYKIGVNYEVDEVQKNIVQPINLELVCYDSLVLMKEAYEMDEVSAYIDYVPEKNKYIVYTGTGVTDMSVSTLVLNYLEQYNQYLGNIKLNNNGIDPSTIYNNFEVDAKNILGEELDSSSFLVDMILGIAFTYIIMAITMAAVNMATSAIAVEKEHGTLETILTLPITTTELLMGKYLATVIIGAIASLIGLFMTIGSLGIASSKFAMYSRFGVTIPSIVYGILICIIASFLIGGIAIFLTSNAKSYKEAQASGQMLSILSIVPMFIGYLGIKISEVGYLIPILNYTTLLTDLNKGGFTYLNLIIVVISTIFYVFVLLVVLFRKFKSEKVLFGE